MTKRATLSLSPEEDRVKEQALGLKPQDDSESYAHSTRPKRARVAASPSLQSITKDASPDQIRDRNDSGSILQTVLVVAAAALSLYLLGRRFF